MGNINKTINAGVFPWLCQFHRDQHDSQTVLSATASWLTEKTEPCLFLKSRSADVQEQEIKKPKIATGHQYGSHRGVKPKCQRYAPYHEWNSGL
jgi:hypothetical protein